VVSATHVEVIVLPLDVQVLTDGLIEGEAWSRQKDIVTGVAEGLYSDLKGTGAAAGQDDVALLEGRLLAGELLCHCSLSLCECGEEALGKVE
jgi:hypothetical protein